MEAWKGFKQGDWCENINVRDFIQKNYKPYTGGGEFLAEATPRTKKLLGIYEDLLGKERENGGVLSIDTEKVSSLLSYAPGYVDKENELIFGLQTEKPLERGVNPFGGIRMARSACESYGYKLSKKIEANFEYKTTHNDGVFRVYTSEMRKLRKYGILTGLPDAYGRGRIIGDYRRVALYGTDRLIAEKKKDFESLAHKYMDEENIRLREEVFRQVDFLGKLTQMAAGYGDDISRPAENTREAMQWTYYAYLGAIKEQNGAAESIGRTSTFFDIYIERDMANGLLDEKSAQELMDQLVLKLRMSRQLRTPEYNELFAGDPTWVTESIGGMGEDGRTLVTKTSFRVLHTLYNLNAAPEPNLTVLWSEKLPEKFKKFCAEVSIDTSSIQYESDDLMRPIYGDDYGIACCVSAMKIGKQMQFFGARCNLAKVLLMAINGGRDEMTGERVAFEMPPLKGKLDYNEVLERYHKYIDWLAETYVNTMNIIHYMHDKYAYEKLQMALHDTFVERLMAFGAAGISVATDSLSAIKYASVTPVADETGLIVDYVTEGDFPKYGNDDDRADDIAKWVVSTVMGQVKRLPVYRGAVPTQSILTITSNVEYGKNTGSFPSGHVKGTPYAPGANPENGMDSHGMLPSMFSVGKIDYNDALDGISLTNTITPDGLGRDEDERINNLVGILDAGNGHGLYHANINVLRKEQLEDAVEHPEKYPHLTVRVSGYAVNFVKLTKEQQLDVISRTFHQGAVED